MRAMGAGDALRVGLVAEFPPPAAGMTVQAATLRDGLAAEGVEVVDIATNAPLPGALRPLAGVRFLRGALNWLRFAGGLRRVARVDVVHVFAASWLSFFLFAAPAVVVGKLLRRGVILHYHGGSAGPFLDRFGRWAAPVLGAAHCIVVPSSFLREVFERHGFTPACIDNPVSGIEVLPRQDGDSLVILSCRNLAPVYDIATALRTFGKVVTRHAEARMIIAGDGVQRVELEALAAQLGLAGRVEFVGSVAHEEMGALRRRATVLLNTSRADNQPVSLIEAMVAGLPIVSTDAGGIPRMVADDREAFLAPIGDVDALATQILRLECEPETRARLVAAARERARRYAWNRIGPQWLELYARIRVGRRPEPQARLGSVAGGGGGR